ALAIPLILDSLYTSFSYHDTASPEIYTLSLHDALPIFNAAVFNGEHFTRPAKAALNFIDHHQDIVVVADLSDFLQETGGRRVETTLTQHRFQHNGGGFVGRGIRLHGHLQTTQGFIFANTVIGHRIRRTEHHSGHRAKGGLVRRGFTVHRHGHKGTAVITAVKTDHVGLTGCRAGNLDRIFQSLGTGIGQHDFGVALYRNHFTEFLSQFYVALVRHNGLTGMHQLIQLGFDRFNDFRMA